MRPLVTPINYRFYVSCFNFICSSHAPRSRLILRNFRLILYVCYTAGGVLVSLWGMLISLRLI